MDGYLSSMVILWLLCSRRQKFFASYSHHIEECIHYRSELHELAIVVSMGIDNFYVNDRMASAIEVAY